MNILKNNYVKYGLIMSLVTVICLLIMELTGQNESFDNKSPFQLLYMFIAPAVVWYLEINAKKKNQKNKLTFKDGLKEGFKISLVYALVSPFIFLFYYLIVNPDILSYVKNAYNMPSSSNAQIIAVDMFAQFVSAVVFGTIYASIISFILRSKKSTKGK